MVTPKNHLIDVRPLIANGEEPFELIRSQVDSLVPSDTLTVIAPFLPAPLIELLRSEGYAATPEHRSDGAWSVHFRKP